MGRSTSGRGHSTGGEGQGVNAVQGRRAEGMEDVAVSRGGSQMEGNSVP